MKLYQAKRRIFPDPAVETIDGIVAMGDQLNVSTLFEAYSFGIFPWPHEDLPLLWYSPDPRGVIDFENVRINKSLRKFLKNETDFYGREVASEALPEKTAGLTQPKIPKYSVTFNTAFADVMQKCSEVERPGQGGTWIHSPMKRAYLEFHQAGYAHSIEVWRNDEADEKNPTDKKDAKRSDKKDDVGQKKLVGGLYGVYVAGVFAGESMFYLESNTSKLALLSLIERLKAHGLKWMDIQMITPATESLGGRYISRREYLQRLEEAKLVARRLTL